jgi:two-component system response regulator DesR
VLAYHTNQGQCGTHDCTCPDSANHDRGPHNGHPRRESDALRILLAEDVAMIRGALTALIELEPDLKVVAQVDKGEQILPVALHHRPDVAIIDVDRPRFDGFPAAVRIHEQLPSCRTLILTSAGRPGMLRSALGAAVSGFIVKEAAPGQLATAIRNVATGSQMVEPDLTVATWGGDQMPLSAREHAVLRMASDGAEPAEIAAAMCLTIGTVRNYLTTIVSKLHARNRVDAVRKAYDQGWLP